MQTDSADDHGDLKRSLIYRRAHRRLMGSFLAVVGLVTALVLLSAVMSRYLVLEGTEQSRQAIRASLQSDDLATLHSVAEHVTYHISANREGMHEFDVLRAEIAKIYARHNEIMHGDQPESFNGLRNARQREIFLEPLVGFDARLADLSSAITRLLRSVEEPHLRTEAAFDVLASARLAKAEADRSRSQFIADAIAYRLEGNRTQSILTAVILVVLALVFFGILTPLARRFATRTAEIDRARRELEQSARWDTLTGLGNRVALQEWLEQNAEALVGMDRRFGLCRIEIGNLGQINERIGLGASESVVQLYAKRVPSLLRNDDILTSVGEAAFVAIIMIDTHEQLAAMVERLHAELSKSVTIDGQQVQARIGMGYLLVSPETEDRKPTSLLTSIKLAALRSRTTGSEAPVVFAPALRKQFDDEVERRRDLEQAFARGEIKAWFQPQISLNTRAIIGFEALARWEHPEMGIISPDRFIPLVERENLHGSLTHAILNSSLDSLVEWRRNGFDIPSVGVNFAPSDLRNPRLVDQINWAIDERDLESSSLTVELLETLLVQGKSDPATRNISRLSELGYPIDLDDFGTGHASIQSVLHYPISRIKIDRGFIRGIEGNPNLQRLVGVMITMAHDLSINVLAEGVETPAEEALLRAMGCDAVQGFGLAKPMPFSDTLTWLAGYRTAPGPALESRAG